MIDDNSSSSYWRIAAESNIKPHTPRAMRDGKDVHCKAIASVVSIAIYIEENANGDAIPLVDFIVDQVMRPLRTHEPTLAKREFEAAFTVLYQDQSDSRWRAVIHFCIATWGSRRHYIYPNRLTYKPPETLLAWLRNIKQGEPLWTWLRLFLLGASGVAAMVGANEKWESYEPNPAERMTAQRLLTNCLGLTEPKPFSARTLVACAHGTAFEDLGRQIYCNLTQQRVIEIGTAISPSNSCFSHSPDGLVVDKDGRTIGMIEIKCQEIKETCYDTCPDGYLPQCLQGMYVHGAPWCDFVSLSYLPERKDPNVVTFTIERIHYEESVMKWMLQCFDSFSKTLAHLKPELPLDFYKAFEERMIPCDHGIGRQHQFNKVQRHYISVWGDQGLRVPAASLRMRLEHAVGSKKLAQYWKKVRPVK